LITDWDGVAAVVTVALEVVCASVPELNNAARLATSINAAVNRTMVSDCCMDYLYLRL
jgi:hypothetical protein